MPTREVMAMFIGADGAMGYRHGLTYRLKLRDPGRLRGAAIEIIGGGAFCPYSSEAAFERNWRVLSATPTTEDKP